MPRASASSRATLRLPERPTPTSTSLSKSRSVPANGGASDGTPQVIEPRSPLDVPGHGPQHPPARRRYGRRRRHRRPIAPLHALEHAPHLAADLRPQRAPLQRLARPDRPQRLVVRLDLVLHRLHPCEGHRRSIPAVARTGHHRAASPSATRGGWDLPSSATAARRPRRAWHSSTSLEAKPHPEGAGQEGVRSAKVAKMSPDARQQVEGLRQRHAGGRLSPEVKPKNERRATLGFGRRAGLRHDYCFHANRRLTGLQAQAGGSPRRRSSRSGGRPPPTRRRR